MGATIFDIRGRLYEELVKSPLAAEITGEICRGDRATGSDKEDIVFYDFGADNETIQKALVVLNIYVPDFFNGKEWVINEDRCNVLTRLADEVLDGINLGDYFVDIKEHSSFAVEDDNIKQHGIRFNLNILQF
jgi:hypothetical protein